MSDFVWLQSHRNINTLWNIVVLGNKKIKYHPHVALRDTGNK